MQHSAFDIFQDNSGDILQTCGSGTLTVGMPDGLITDNAPGLIEQLLTNMR